MNKQRERPKSASSSEHEVRVRQEAKIKFLSNEELGMIDEFLKGTKKRAEGKKQSYDTLYYSIKTNDQYLSPLNKKFVPKNTNWSILGKN